MNTRAMTTGINKLSIEIGVHNIPIKIVLMGKVTLISQVKVVSLKNVYSTLSKI